jgi:hypothetical protein
MAFSLAGAQIELPPRIPLAFASFEICETGHMSALNIAMPARRCKGGEACSMEEGATEPPCPNGAWGAGRNEKVDL